MPVVCTCRFTHVDESQLRPIGFQLIGDGDIARLQQCTICHSTICAEILEETCLCAMCKAPVTGRAGDVRVVVPRWNDTGVASQIVCRSCARTVPGDVCGIDEGRASLRDLVSANEFHRNRLERARELLRVAP